MSFNPDPSKKVQEVIFSKRLNQSNHLPLNLNDTVVIQSATHKHLGIILDATLDFHEPLKTNLVKSARQLDY